MKISRIKGGEAEVIGHYIKGVANNYQYFVRCKSCKARPRSYRTFKKKEEAIEAWNTRKPMDRIVEQLENISKEMLTIEINTNYGSFLKGRKIGFKKAIDIVKKETNHG